TRPRRTTRRGRRPAGRNSAGALALVDAWASRLRIPRVVGTKPVRGCGGSRRPPPPSKWRSWQVEATVRTRPRLVDGQNAAGSAFSRRSSTNPGQLVPTNFRLWVSGPGRHDRTRSFGKRCAPGCPVDKNLGDDRIKTAAT